MIFQSIKTHRLTKKQLKQILSLKDTNWRFGIKIQNKWFKKNIKSSDLHNVMVIKNTIVGYTLLAQRKFELLNKKKINKKKYLLFATLILNKKFRNYFFASQMMRYNIRIITKRKMPTFLLCKNDKINFYKLFGWVILKKAKFKVVDHKHSLKGMAFNFSKIIGKKNNFINFYYH